ncbi:hypothetical protein, conserved [Trypanosoma brucei gambiense DAL972]|uniref:Uncharacterized protein n=2 Tax=Trypanosoma brucei TaxID=5691 RepID=C9ZYN6_TRYB9|nr:hypothetical protein, conserved [Trypanosoma brucei gambiense DAL972]RHW70580.1 HAD hydrolase [Trypanosoma brucei equiperdum]CBH14535.1 hypothetical protein, conserved [Trypanosoma brucei gambiense DAL972]|eukprot:XP_011776801.1 hypothetical protein, conserved [Trypanosoma brucei gambiense DAL972]
MFSASWRGIARPTALLRRRFIPPWERDGKAADDFFAGLMQSSNPVITKKKMQSRHEEMERQALTEELSPSDMLRIEELHLRNEAVLRERRDFVPYGAKPVIYFDNNKMAAIGDYASRLKTHAAPSSGGGYSDDVLDMLQADLHQKIPYKFESSVERRGNELRWPLHGTAGIVLDVDGVVYRMRKIIEGSDVAIRKLMELKIPLLFMTNGGGVSEEKKAEEYSRLLGCTIDASQVLLAHTPMKLLAQMYKGQKVLIVGSLESANVAKAYGFDGAISIQRFQAEHPELVPFRRWGSLEKVSDVNVPFPEIAAVFVLREPEDAFCDIQTIIDVLLSPRGKVGKYVSSTQSIPLYYASDDFLWAAEAELPRLGNGAFREMLHAVFYSLTGQNLHVTTYGKPRAIAYAFAERRMKEVTSRLGWNPEDMRAIFMVGDNVDTDIMGANARGGKWTSVHVLSGVGVTPVAYRTKSENDTEFEWMEKNGDKTPHYVAPTLDHFARELLAFPENAMLQNKKKYYGMPNPVDLHEDYGFS